MEIEIGETHIRLTTDLKSHSLEDYIYSIRADLKSHIAHNQYFLHAMKPLKPKTDDLSPIVERMYESSDLCDVGPMACVAGTVSELSLDYLISCGSKNSIVENGGDIAVINSRTVLCGIFSNNPVLGNDIAFKIKKRHKPLGICTSSGKMGHSISFGLSDSVTVISKSPSIADGLATRIANGVNGEDSQERVYAGLETADDYDDLFEGVLIVCGGNVATMGRLPDIVETSDFDLKI